MKNLCKFINLKNLKNNAIEIKKQLDGKVCAVLKSNAYGHGLKNVATALKPFVDFFAVLDFVEAKQILHLKKPILMLSKPTKKQVLFACNFKVHQVVFCLEDVKNAENIAKKLKKTCFLHVKINTGMNRMGIGTLKEFLEIKKEIKKSNFLKLKGVLTHFGSGFGKRTKNQFENFENFLSFTPKNVLRHFANSEISSFVKPQKNEMARLGLAFFGYGKFLNLKPVMSVFAKVVGITNVKKGDFVGYGNKHKAKKDMRLAVLAIGYANGLMRCYHKKGFVLLHGKKAKIVADICMNQCIVDVTNIGETKIGDFATIMGENNDKKITASDIAKKCNTIPYEILTNFSGIAVTNKKPKT